MNRLEPASLARLEAMGIAVWERRASPTGAVMTAADPAATTQSRARIRLASGEGDCLLVQRQAWAGHPDPLLDDIRACLGTERCRFGQWAIASTAGEDASELVERGVRHILCFGPAPDSGWEGLIELPSLVELAADWRAKRALWQALKPLLEGR